MGLMAYLRPKDPQGQSHASKPVTVPTCRDGVLGEARVIWRRPHCLNPSVQKM